MHIYQDFTDSRLAHLGASAVTIGNFDGCHVGHQSLVRSTVELARSLNAASIAVTFSPRPDAYFSNCTQEKLLFTDDQKSRAFSELGMDIKILKRFDRALSQLSAEQFYDQILRQCLHAQAIVIGDNFRFGQGRQGTAQYLKERAARDGTTVEIGEAVQVEGQRVSSTRIRDVLQKGDVALASRLLGRPFLLEGEIKQGDQIGRTLGVPTANLEGVTQIIPRFGIYAGYTWISGDVEAFPSVMKLPSDIIPTVFSIGVRPTLDQSQPPVRIEGHLLSGSYGANELYGKRAGFYLTHWLRGEARFDNLEELKSQMHLDIAQARRLLGNAP